MLFPWICFLLVFVFLENGCRWSVMIKRWTFNYVKSSIFLISLNFSLALPLMWRAVRWILLRANNNQRSRRQRCMKGSDERWLLSAYTLTWLSVRISTLQPRNRSCHNLRETRIVSSSNWLMFKAWRAIKGGKFAWKNSPKQTAPQASRQASHTKRSGLDTVTLVGITETPL